VGSVKSGPKVAVILSLVESCRRLGLPVKEYLLAALPGMSLRKHSEAAHLIPARWKASQPSSGLPPTLRAIGNINSRIRVTVQNVIASICSFGIGQLLEDLRDTRAVVLRRFLGHH
jgi:hypothetical protein